MIYTLVDFDGQQAADYTLLIQVGEQQHALAVVDDEQQLRVAATYDPAHTEKEIQDILDLDFGKVKLAVPDSRYTFVPADTFDEAHMHTYSRYLSDDGIGDPLLADIEPLGIKLLYQTSRVGVEAMEARFPELNSYPAVQSLLSGIANCNIAENAPFLMLDKHSSQTTICFFDAGKLVYGNDFDTDHMDSLTYYLLTVFNHLGITDKQPLLCLSGDVNEGDAYYERLSTYGGQVVLADSGLFTGIAVPAAFVPHQHRFLTLFGLHLCG